MEGGGEGANEQRKVCGEKGLNKKSKEERREEWGREGERGRGRR